MRLWVGVRDVRRTGPENAVATTSWHRSLDWLAEDDLAEICADGHTFADARFLRLVDALDLPAVTGGDVTLSFVTVWAGRTPVALCPVLRCRGTGVHFLYSLRRFYFEHWIEDAIRLDPGSAAVMAKALRVVNAYRRLLEATGTPLDDWLVATSPLSYRGQIPVAPSSPIGRAEVYGAVVAAVQRKARACRVPACFLGVEGESSRLGDALVAGGCARTFLMYDNQLDLTPFADFDEYLHSFRRTTRRAFQRDLKRIAAAGVQYRFLDRFGSIAPLLTDLYETTYRKYGDSFHRHRPDFWRTLPERLGDRVEIVAAFHEDRLLGFSALLKNTRRGEMWTYRVGRLGDDEFRGVPFYFGLSFYEPIRRALDLGFRRLWLGPAGYEAKSVRGAALMPLYSYFWFPRRVDRVLLQPYLKFFGDVSRRQIRKSVRRPRVRIGGEVVEPAGVEA